jgi:uncharacterized protein with HEPN domain
MSERGDADLVADMLEAVSRIRRYTDGMSFDGFLDDTRTQDAVVRNLEIIGEAAKKLSAKFRRSHGGTKWRDMPACGIV